MCLCPKTETKAGDKRVLPKGSLRGLRLSARFAVEISTSLFTPLNNLGRVQTLCVPLRTLRLNKVKSFELEDPKQVASHSWRFIQCLCVF